MNKKYTFTMVVVKPTGKGGKPLKPKPIKPENKSTGGGMMKKYNKGGEMLKGGQKKLDKREIGRRGLDPYAVQPRKPSPQPLDKPKPGIGSLQKADIEKNNKIKQVKAKFAALKETARDELTPMKSDRVFSKYRRPDSAKEFYADEPGSKYEGMAKEAMKEKINYFKNMKQGGLTGGQRKLDKNKDGKISGDDFKLIRREKPEIKPLKAREGIMIPILKTGKRRNMSIREGVDKARERNKKQDERKKEIDKSAEKYKVGGGGANRYGPHKVDVNRQATESLFGRGPIQEKIIKFADKFDKKSQGGEMKPLKAREGKMVKTPDGKKEEDKYSKYVRSIELPDAKDIRKVVKKNSTGGEMKPRKFEKAFLGKMIKGAGKSIGRLFGANKSATATPGTPTMSKSGIGGKDGMLPQLLQKAIDDGNIKPASKGRMMKASKGGGMMQRPMGGEIKKGYGAARQSGMGLQDENLQPGKSMDYYKDLI
jgi:hypothetical protein